ncbi:MAG: sigma-54-dependent Fis family transcriptional regulator [Ignavibacteriales bacterium]|nr:sigma-54-dependent Fis family transcriptional regulator [Ignavibacteriales bacterium]
MAERILIVDDEQIIRESIAFILRKEGYSVSEAANGKEAYDKILEDAFDVVITDLEMPEMKGIELLEKITHTSPQTLVMIITAYGSLETAIDALRQGASDYILKPVEFDELLVRIRRLLEGKKLLLENQVLKRELQREYEFSSLIGKSPAMLKVFDTIQQVAPTDSTVLITGKSGTGKELVARAVHFSSRRAGKPIITVNCGAIPETLIESELFGHKKGAFTGAVSDKVGYFKAAEGGTLFLDEISEMPFQLQVKLLRALEQKEIIPVGTSTAFSINVRFLASTNRDLKKEVEAGNFREDLYYRLNVVEVHLPPLAERPDDIPLLVEHFVDKYRKEMRKNIKGVENDVMRLLLHHEWKGEVRELENIIERSVIFCNDDTISAKHLPEFFTSETFIDFAEEKQSLEQAINDFERRYIFTILTKNGFDKEKVASILKISVPTLYRRIKDLNIIAAE